MEIWFFELNFFLINSCTTHTSKFLVYPALLDQFQTVFCAYLVPVLSKQRSQDVQTRRFPLFNRTLRQLTFVEQTVEHLLHQNYCNEIKETKTVHDCLLQRQDYKHCSHF